MNECNNKYDTYIEKLFFEKLQYINDRNLRRRVELAWLSDKEYYTGLTKTIVYEFMNYSLHDESHSTSILQYIYLLLGKDKIDQLSVGDLWLLLEAAYSHDIGMSTDYQDLYNLWIDENNIEELVSDIKNTDDKDIIGTYQEVGKWLAQNEKNINKENFAEKHRGWPLDIRKGITYINTVYIRKNHAKRSKEKLLQLINGKDDLTIEDRLYKIVADIDYLHNASFEEIFDCFESVETGFETDTIHPCLIAQLLRVGDVLDIRNNRFEYRNIVYNGGLPYISQTQYDKHKSVTRFHIDTKEVIVHIESTNVITCQSGRQWLDWIQFELDHLIQSWNLFTEGFLGNFDLTKIELIVKNGKYNYTNTDFNTFLKADSNRMLDLLMGSNFYDSSFVLFREYVQNAIDATKVKLALDLLDDKKYIKSIKPAKFVDILPEKIISKENILFDDQINIFEKNRIEIEITMKDDIVQNDHNNMFIVKIKDHGIGMDEVGLNSLFNIGKSWSGRKKIKNKFSKIPTWLTPTGGFGIGFLSGFLLSDKIQIVTNSKNGKRYHLTIHSPKKGAKIEKNVDDIRYAEPGTECILEINFFNYYNHLINYLNQKKSSNDFNDSDMSKIFEFSLFNKQDQLRIISISLKNILRKYILDALIPITIKTPQLPMYYKINENSLYGTGDYDYEIGKVKSVLECNAYWSKAINGFVRFNLIDDNNLMRIGYKGIFVDEYNKGEQENSVLVDLGADCIASIDLFDNNLKDILNINRSSLKNDYQIESLINSVFIEYLNVFVKSLENNHLQNKLSIFTHYKVIKLLLYYQEFEKNHGSMKLLSDNFDALYIYDKIEKVINLKLIDEFNNLLSATNVFENIKFDDRISFSKDEIIEVYNRINIFFQKLEQSTELLNTKFIEKGYLDYVDNMTKIFKDFISNVSLVDTKNSHKNNLKCIIRLKEKYLEFEDDDLLKGIRLDKESFIDHLFNNNEFYCLVKEGDVSPSGSCKKEDLENKKMFYFDFNNLKKGERSFFDFAMYLECLFHNEIINGRVQIISQSIENVEGYTLYKIMRKKEDVGTSEKEIEKDIVELIYKSSINNDFSNFISLNSKKAGKYEILLLDGCNHLGINSLKYCIVNPFEKQDDIIKMNVLLNSISNSQEAEDEIKNNLISSDIFKMKVEYIYFSKVEKLGSKNVNRLDIEKAYIQLVIDVINFAKRKYDGLIDLKTSNIE